MIGNPTRDRVRIGEGKAKENSHKLLRGLKCKDCDAEIIYDYCENIYVCLGCGL